MQALIKTNITFFDEKLAVTEVCTTPENALCKLVKKQLLDKCKKTDEQALLTCRNSGDLGCMYNCHFGFTEMLFKMEHLNQTYGYIMIGPFRRAESNDSANSAKINDISNNINGNDSSNNANANSSNGNDSGELINNVKSFCERYGADEDLMLNAYYETPEADAQKFEAIKTIIHAMFDYAVNKNIVTLKHGLFETAVRDYVQNNLNKKLNGKTLCKRFNISQKQLCALIKKATRLTPQKYVNQQRVEKAKNLLATTDIPLQDVADSIGVPDYNYFIKLFKRATGSTPSEYRNVFLQREK